MSWAFNIPLKVEKAPSWVNPYVTDGLVAMWDGYDATLDSWVDRVGGLSLSAVGASPSLNERHGVVFGGAGAFFGECPDFSFVDACVMIPSSTGITTLSINSGTANAQIGYYAASILTQVPRVDGGGFGQAYNSIHTYSWMQGVDNSNKYLDGVSAAHIASQDYWSNRNDAIVSIGGRRRSGQWGYGRIDCYCIRLYSRALTAVEVAANYAVDKARFNLS